MSAVVLAYQADPWLVACVRNLLASTEVDVRVILVDNGCSNPALPELRLLDHVHTVGLGENLGYSGGCNLGGAAAEAEDVLVFVNSDCLVEPGALAVLAQQAAATGGLVTASIRLGQDTSRLNSAGNPVHFLGFSWAGRLGELASDAEMDRIVTSVSGACFGVTREVWDFLGGFPAKYFAYHEDVELSLRCWLSGRPVNYVPGAVAYHYYEYSRHPTKMYLLERNRLLTWITVLELRTLVLLLPAMFAAEVAVAVLAVKQGWFSQKARGWLWLVRNAIWISERRRMNQGQRRRSDQVLSPLFTGVFKPGGDAMPSYVTWGNRALDAYWRFVQKHM